MINRRKTMIKCCIFDLDGTVLDTINTITHYVNVAHDKFGLKRITADECKYFAGNGAKDLIYKATTSRGLYDEGERARLYDFYMNAYDSAPLYLTGVFDGIIEMLGKLREAGVKLALLSNKPDFATKSLVEHFFSGLFDIALGGREGVPLKPDPTAPLEIMRTFGVSGEETAWIGDSSTDMQTGKNINAKMRIGCLWGFRKEDELVGAGASHIVSHPSEITSLVLADE